MPFSGTEAADRIAKKAGARGPKVRMLYDDLWQTDCIFRNCRARVASAQDPFTKQKIDSSIFSYSENVALAV